MFYNAFSVAMQLVLGFPRAFSLLIFDGGANPDLVYSFGVVCSF
jgi:hypothetical protein